MKNIGYKNDIKIRLKKKKKKLNYPLNFSYFVNKMLINVNKIIFKAQHFVLFFFEKESFISFESPFLYKYLRSKKLINIVNNN